MVVDDNFSIGLVACVCIHMFPLCFNFDTDSQTYPGPFVIVDVSRKSEVFLFSSPLNIISSFYSVIWVVFVIWFIMFLLF